MLLLERYARRAEAIARIGEEVRADARATGTPVPYTEPAYGTDVIVDSNPGGIEQRRSER